MLLYSALQGSFAEHVHIIDQLGITGVSAIQVRTKDDLQRCTGLILPGGESTTISLLAQKGGLLEPLRQFVQDAKFDRGRAVWGTCAGMIMLASQVVGAKAGFEGLNGVDYSVVRNQWGRQVRSYCIELFDCIKQLTELTGCADRILLSSTAGRWHLRDTIQRRIHSGARRALLTSRIIVKDTAVASFGPGAKVHFATAESGCLGRRRVRARTGRRCRNVETG